MNDLIARFDANRSLLRTKSVDRKLDGMNAVHPLSHLHRMYLGTKGRWEFTSANPAQEIRKAFKFYWETVQFLKKTGLNLLGSDPIPDGEIHKIVDSVRTVVVWRRSR